VAQTFQTVAALAKGYDQINSSVGQLATDTLLADTKALASGSSSDASAYATEQSTLTQLADDRDAAATKIKKMLSNAALGIAPSGGQLTSALALEKALLTRAHQLAASS
jgi:hypothetical protein